jgi:hypothetical protein
MPTQISPSSVADLAVGLNDLPLTDTRAAELAAELVRLNAAVRQAATMLHFDSAPGDFQRVLEAAGCGT